jgi:hypothetical protein
MKAQHLITVYLFVEQHGGQKARNVIVAQPIMGKIDMETF